VETFTFLFTDIEGSTALLRRLGEDLYAQLLADHHALIRSGLAAHDGKEVDTQGDAFFAVFSSSRACMAAVTQMQRALASVDPPLPFSGCYSLTDHLAESLATQKVEVALLSAMAGLALPLSAVGIFALVANMVAQRTREIGLRIALGSTIRQAMAHVAAPGIRSSAIGLVLGLVLCLGVLRVLRSVLYGVSAYDASSMAGVVVVLTLVTMFATIIPTLRISRTDPATTLRDE